MYKKCLDLVCFHVHSISEEDKLNGVKWEYREAASEWNQEEEAWF
jgi:hypothetical protein